MCIETLIAAATSAVVGAGANKLMAGGKPPAPATPTPPQEPKPPTPDVMGRRRAMNGMGQLPATLLTGPGGITAGTGTTLLGQ